MNSVEFDNNLASRLGDEEGATYSEELRRRCSVAAIKEYSRYRPCRRGIGTGNLWLPGQEDEESLVVIGGPFNVGDALTLSPFLTEEESVTVLSVSNVTDTALKDAPVRLITLSAPLSNSHSSGAFIVNVAGLTLTTDRTHYPLPPDFVRVDKLSFDLATGVRTTAHNRASFYDKATENIQLLSGQSQMQKIGIGNVGSGQYPFAGNPANFATALGINPNSAGLSYQILSGGQPMLRVTPAPSGTALLNFDYYGMHIFETVSEQDIEPILEYARAKCLQARAAKMAGADNSWVEGDVEEDSKETAQELRLQAKDVMLSFDNAIRKAPYAVGG